MNLRRLKTTNRGFNHYLASVDLPDPPSDEERDRLVSELLEGSSEAKGELVSKHIRLILGIVGRYVEKVNSDRMADDLVSAGLLAATRVVDRVRMGDKKMFNNNISGVIVEAAHSAISRVIEKAPVVPVPGSTKRYRLSKGEQPPETPKCYHLTNSENKNVDYEYDPESVVDKQGWWRDYERKQKISESEIQEILDKVVESSLERSIMRLRTSYVNGKPMSDRRISEILGVGTTTVFEIRREIGDRVRKELE